MVEIIEVLDRSQQGMTKPFVCRGDDGQTYYVKGIGAGRRSQVCEWIGGCLARRFGLPVPEFTVVEVPSELMMLESGVELRELGAGPAFGSQSEPGLIELKPSTVPRIPETIRRDVLVFDWWVRNMDRTLTSKGGNPNLFWAAGGQEIVVLDHNQIFDEEFYEKEFFEYHAFTGAASEIRTDLFLPDQYGGKMERCLADWDTIVAGIPEEWLFLDEEQMDPANVNLEQIHTLLRTCENEDFWNWP